MRMEQEASRRNTAPVVISSVLSLLVVGIAIAAVAWLVLREPSSAVDSAERLEPVGTALPAPTEAPALPTTIPTREPEPEPTALGFSGDAPSVSGLPTVAPEVDAGPTPTPRVIDLPTAVPTVPPPPPPTLPPPAPENTVPVVALQPVEQGPPPTAAAPSAPQAESVTRQPTSVPTPNRNDNDPFDIFDNTSESRTVPALDDPLQRVRDMQDGQDGRDVSPASGRRVQNAGDPLVIPTIAVSDVMPPTPDIPPIVPSANVPITTGRDGTVEIIMPDVDAIIARATDPNRNPNVGNAGRSVIDRGANDGDANKRKNSRDRGRSKTPTPRAGVPNIVPSSPRVNPRPGQGQGQCDNPFAALPPDKQPKNFPFDNC
jgi:hypothetical protein